MSATEGAVLSPQGWWDAAAEGRLLLLRCSSCGTTWVPFMPYCPVHGPGPQLAVVESALRGTLYSWVGIHYSVSSPDDVPFTVGSVRLEEGAMLYGRLVDVPEGVKLEGDAAVEGRFTERDGRSVVDFRLV